MKIYRTLIVPLILIVALVFTSLTTACSPASVQKVINASADIEVTAQTLVDTANQAVTENLITQAQASAIVPKLAAFSKSVTDFKTAAEALKANYGKIEDVPQSKIIEVSNLFDNSVITPFLEVLKDLKVIQSSTKIIAAIGVIRLAVLTIAQTFGKTEAVSQINYEWDKNIKPAVPPYV